MLFSIGYHLEELLLAPVPLDLGPFPFVDFLAVALELRLASGYLLVQFALPALLLLQLALERLVLRLQFFALLHNTVHALPDRLHLLFQALRLLLLGNRRLQLRFEGLQFLLLPAAGGLYQKKQKL